MKKELKGLTAVLGMEPGYTFEVSRVLEELGIKVVWVLAWHYDKKYENGDVPPSRMLCLPTRHENIFLKERHILQSRL